MTQHILVTGGAGFIGSHIAEEFLRRGWRVSVVDDLSTGRTTNVAQGVELHVADLCDPASGDLIRRLQPDAISHHAAQIDVRKSVVDPARDAEMNIVATVRLLELAREIGVKRFVFASTGGAIYGEPLTVPQTEEHACQPLSPYGCAKLAVEHYLHYFHVVHGLSTLALRYANVYGPRQNPHGEAGVVAIFAARLLRGESVTINGDGTQTRDYVHVRDVVAANVAAVEHGELHGSFNVGTGIEVSVNKLYAAMIGVLGLDLQPQHGAAKVGEQMRSVIDGTRLRAIAGLPEPVALEQGLVDTLQWFRATADQRTGESQT